MSRSIAWEPLLATLAATSRHDERLDAVLQQITALTGLEAAYLYVFDDSRTRLHLVRARGASLTTGIGYLEN